MVALDALSAVTVLVCATIFSAAGFNLAAIAVMQVVLAVLDAMETPTVQAALPQMFRSHGEDVMRRAMAVVNVVNHRRARLVPAVLGQIYLVATATMDMFRMLGALPDIRFSGTDASGWYIPEAKEAMENGSILYAGKYSEPDYERIISEGCGLAIENTMILHSPEVKEKLESFGTPVLVDHSSYEAHPLGRTEWIRLYGVLTGKEKRRKRHLQSRKQLCSVLQKKVRMRRTQAGA